MSESGKSASKHLKLRYVRQNSAMCNSSDLMEIRPDFIKYLAGSLSHYPQKKDGSQQLWNLLFCAVVNKFERIFGAGFH